ncbi:MAG: trypsin-like peptidase domain-containing protein [Oscillospiraceae bacterium]|nr:trypsin-like peptidase domain-containing protein [Oscillospiraceae bacterium]
MKKLLAILLVACLMYPAGSQSASAQTYGSINDAMNGVARVYTEGDVDYYVSGKLVESEKDTALGTGSAFAVGKGTGKVSYFVTNRHVVTGSEETAENDNGVTITAKSRVTRVYIIMDDVPTKCPAEIVTTNEGASDLAILRLKTATDQRQPCTLHPYTDAIEEHLVGSDVWAVGYPGISDIIYKDVKTIDDMLISSVKNVRTAKGSITGTIDAEISSTGGSYIETNATVSAGNSGGPLVDENGTVLGVCTTMSTSVVGANGAVSVNEVITLLDRYNISYLTVSKTSASSSSGSSVYIYAAVAVAAAAVAVLAVFFIKKRKNRPSQPAGPTPSSSGSRIPPPIPPQAPSSSGARIPNPIPSRAASPTPYRAPASSPSPSEPRAAGRTLYCITGALAGTRYELRQGDSLMIGRNQNSCRVWYPDRTPGVSREHCEIIFDGERATVRDLNSTYGTFLNGIRLPADRTVRLHRGCALDIGSEKNRFTLQ